MKTLIIGGGMAGLTYGILSAQNDDVVICERNARVGKKISMTGNGKCNIGNKNVSSKCFNSSKIVDAVLDAVSVQDYLNFLTSCGIYTFSDSVGRLYPLSESASNVVDCLRTKYAQSGGKLICDCNVSAITRQNGKFLVTINSKTESFDKVVLACGSQSGVQPTNVFNLVDKKYFTPLVPSLVPVKTKIDKILNGLRAKATVTLFADNVQVAQEIGEVQFKDFGLSGICIYNLSAYIARDIVKGINKKYVFSLDLVPNLTTSELTDILQKRIDSDVEKNMQNTYFYGILHNKIAESIVNRSGISAQKLAETAKNYTFNFEKLADFSLSQVTAGGIDEKFINIDNLTLPNGVVALGEILNVDGLCGGNNLYFAAASAIYAFNKAV